MIRGATRSAAAASRLIAASVPGWALPGRYLSNVRFRALKRVLRHLAQG